MSEHIIKWLLEGDVSIQFQVHRDLLGSPPRKLSQLQKRIATEGWGKQLLNFQHKNGHWGRGFYQPKWTSTHYSLLDLKNLGCPQNIKSVQAIIQRIFAEAIGTDGGVNYARTVKYSDVCINGMVINVASYFLVLGSSMDSLIDYLLKVQMEDLGWNCQYLHGDTHSSLHTTISVLEGLLEYRRAGGKHRLKEIRKAEQEAIDFILQHKLFQSDKTGEVIKGQFLMLSYPSRWKYDILRALDYFQAAGINYDPRMDPALEILQQKQRKDQKWPLQLKHKGQAHFDMEKIGQASRWNTLRALRVLRHFDVK